MSLGCKWSHSLDSPQGDAYCLVLNQPLEGWVRAAHVVAPEDAEVLDAHARAILVGWDLEVWGLVLVGLRVEGYNVDPGVS